MARGLILVDAVRSGAAPGTLHCLDASERPLPEPYGVRSSTHTLDLAATLEIARSLGTLPKRVFFFGIEGQDFAFGIGLSPEVERALPALVERISGCARRYAPGP